MPIGTHLVVPLPGGFIGKDEANPSRFSRPGVSAIHSRAPASLPWRSKPRLLAGTSIKAFPAGAPPPRAQRNQNPGINSLSRVQNYNALGFPKKKKKKKKKRPPKGGDSPKAPKPKGDTP
eukprot:FR737121.1.p3 GENE.FR737121.1~~FR737121.1.p3  ORF type:complete len:120 (+),score=39.74 FR737121.1:722-1081(+)